MPSSRERGGGLLLLADRTAEIENVDQFFNESDDYGDHVEAPVCRKVEASERCVFALLT